MEKEQIETLHRVVAIDIDAVMLNPFQPRKTFGREELEELAESIQAVGLIHPPLVRWNANYGKYELISGERRFRACQIAGMQRIAVHVTEGDTEYSAQAALIENIQRVDLNPLEIAQAFQELKELGLSQEEISKRVGKKRSTVANYLRLLELSPKIQSHIAKNEISMGHAKVILSLSDLGRQEGLCRKILDEGLSVRDAEKAAETLSAWKKRKKPSVMTRDFFLERLEEKIRHKLGTKATIQNTGKKGKIILDYYNFDDLDRLLALIGVEHD